MKTSLMAGALALGFVLTVPVLAAEKYTAAPVVATEQPVAAPVAATKRAAGTVNLSKMVKAAAIAKKYKGLVQDPARMKAVVRVAESLKKKK